MNKILKRYNFCYIMLYIIIQKITRKESLMEYQSNLNQFGFNNGFNTQFDNNNYYNNPSFNNGYQTTLNQFDNNYNLNSTPGLYNSNRNYGQFSTGGNLHDTFRVDRYDNIYGGHTTIDLGKDIGKTHLDW